MSDRASAVLYGLIAMCTAALLLLIVDAPTGQNLAIAVAAGIAVTLGFLWRLRRG